MNLRKRVNFTREIDLKTKWMFCLVYLPLYLFCASIIVSAFLKWMLVTFQLSMNYYQLIALLNVLVDLLMMGAVLLVMVDFLKEQWKDFFTDIKQNLFYAVVIGTALIYAVSIFGGLVTAMLGGADTSENQEIIVMISQVQPVLMLLTTVVFAPLLEEILFRGIVFGWLYEKSRFLAYFGSSFFFGGMHVISAMLNGNPAEWVQIFTYLFMGIALSYLYEKTNNIYVPILTHAINNLISMIFIFML